MVPYHVSMLQSKELDFSFRYLTFRQSVKSLNDLLVRWSVSETDKTGS